MKTYKKWREETGRTGLPLSPASCVHDTEAGLRVGWRAALEWAIGEHGPLDKRVNNCDCARARIKKELES